MVDSKDRDALKTARTLMTRHGLDISRADIHVIHGVCYIRGFVQAEAGANISDVGGEVQRVAHFIRQKPGIRNVIIEIATR